MKEALIAFVGPYLPTLLFLVASAVVLALLAILIFLLPSLIKLVKAAVESWTSGKIRERLLDALTKVEIISNDIIVAEGALYKEEMKKILADGKVEQQEVKDLVAKMAKLLEERISPEIATLKKYMVGEAVGDYLTTYLTRKLLEAAEAKGLPKVEKYPPFLAGPSHL